MTFRVIVDSCCDLTRDARGTDPFYSVPLTIHVGENAFRDDGSLDVRQLLSAMAAWEDASHTSCPAPADYLTAFEASEGDLYVVTLSALLSGSHNSAWQAARLYQEAHPERHIHVFNSCSASSGETLIALKIAELAQSGLAFDTVVAAVDKYIQEMNTLFVLEDLSNLKKAGRLTKVQSLLTGALRVKLVMASTPEGEIRRLGQALSMKQAISQLVKSAAEDDHHRGKTLCITHCLCPDRADLLAALAKKHCDFSRILMTDSGGLSAFYTGMGGVVAAY